MVQWKATLTIVPRFGSGSSLGRVSSATLGPRNFVGPLTSGLKRRSLQQSVGSSPALNETSGRVWPRVRMVSMLSYGGDLGDSIPRALIALLRERFDTAKVKILRLPLPFGGRSRVAFAWVAGDVALEGGIMSRTMGDHRYTLGVPYGSK